ncbi:SpaH/EbpB family LPXTG-anchored major pilin [Micrococcoides hystricis]|uniref:SpaH/EbpB family LPXTG-anchored major pilin n=1 Tax=Micrococcoides hystricis TaxID=1572761 RepID=A0ABV6P9H8_9MICC
MKIWKTGLGTRALAAFVALLVGMFGFVGMATAAPDYGNIDTGAQGSITIHKHEHQPAPADQSPEGTSAPLENPVEGVEFTVYPLLQNGSPVNLGDPDAWDGLDGLTPGENCTAPTGYTLGAAETGTTAADGTLTFSKPVGVYLVCETDAPSTVVDRAAPFIVTIPFPHNNGWLYDVHVYPKNAVSSIEKSVQTQTALGLGANLQFPVTTRVPQIGPNDNLSSYVIADTLDTRLTPNGVDSVTVNGTAVDASYYNVTTTGQTITVTFTAAGLTWLESQEGASVVTVFQGTVNAVGDGAIENVATVTIDGNTIESDPVQTNWGDVLIQKNNDATPATGLQGAIFEVYAAEAPYATTCDDAVATGNAIEVGGQTQFTSDSSGRINIAGLFVSDSVNEAVDATQRCYVLREVQAPAGYVTPADADTPVTVVPGVSATVDQTITNTQQSVPELPLTGSAGALIMTIAGLGLVVVAGTLMIISRRRAAQN